MSEITPVYVSIIKETKEKKSKLGKKDAGDFKTIAERLIPILDEFSIDPVTIEPTGFIWGQGDNTHKEYRPGLKLEFYYTLKENEGIMEAYLKLGAMTYQINREYPGAKAIITINGVKVPFYPGSHT